MNVHRTLLVLAVLSLAACTTPTDGPPAADPSVAWMFDGHIVDDQPAFDIYLEVNGTPHPVVDNAVTEYRELERNEWTAWAIPADSLTACTSWWAGQGDVLYARDEGGQLAIYRALLEERTKAGPFRRIRTIAY